MINYKSVPTLLEVSLGKTNLQTNRHVPSLVHYFSNVGLKESKIRIVWLEVYSKRCTEKLLR